MSSDRQGNRLTGATTSAASDYDQALAELNLYRGDPVATVDRALAAAPGFVMAHALKAYLLGLATEPQAVPAAPAGLRGRGARARRALMWPSLHVACRAILFEAIDANGRHRVGRSLVKSYVSTPSRGPT